MSQFDLQPCDDRGYIQKLTANLITEYAKLQNNVCSEASRRVTELLNVDRTINVCGLASPAVLTKIAEGKQEEALELIFLSLGFPPYSAKVLLRGGFDKLTAQEQATLKKYLRDLLIREASQEVGQLLQKVISEKVKCPTPERAAEIIQTTNKVKKVIQRVQKLLVTLNKILNITYSTITAINTGIKAIQSTVIVADASLLVQAGLPVGTAGLTARIIARVEALANNYKSELKTLEKNVCDASKVVAYIATQLNLLIAFLEIVDILLQKCIGDATDLETLEGLNLEAFAEINRPVRVEYRGLTIEIRTDNNSPAIAPRRYAVALDPAGVVVLTGPYSFSSNTEVLIQELQFRIDNQLG